MFDLEGKVKDDLWRMTVLTAMIGTQGNRGIMDIHNWAVSARAAARRVATSSSRSIKVSNSACYIYTFVIMVVMFFYAPAHTAAQTLSPKEQCSKGEELFLMVLRSVWYGQQSDLPAGCVGHRGMPDPTQQSPSTPEAMLDGCHKLMPAPTLSTLPFMPPGQPAL